MKSCALQRLLEFYFFRLFYAITCLHLTSVTYMCEITSFSLEDWVVEGQCERVYGQCVCIHCVYMCVWGGGGAWAFCLPTDMDL